MYHSPCSVYMECSGISTLFVLCEMCSDLMTTNLQRKNVVGLNVFGCIGVERPLQGRMPEREIQSLLEII